MGIIDEPCFASRTEMQNIFENIFILGKAIQALNVSFVKSNCIYCNPTV